MQEGRSQTAIHKGQEPLQEVCKAKVTFPFLALLQAFGGSFRRPRGTSHSKRLTAEVRAGIQLPPSTPAIKDVFRNAQQ